MINPRINRQSAVAMAVASVLAASAGSAQAADAAAGATLEEIVVTATRRA